MLIRMGARPEVAMMLAVCFTTCNQRTRHLVRKACFTSSPSFEEDSEGTTLVVGFPFTVTMDLMYYA